MKLRDEIFRAIELKPQDHPASTIFGGGMWTVKHLGITFEELASTPEKYTDYLCKVAPVLRSSIVYVGSGFNNYLAVALGGKIKPAKTKLTLAPDLVPGTSPIKSPEDLERVDLSLIDKQPVISTVRKATKSIIERLGGDYAICVTGWGASLQAGQFRGTENWLLEVKRNFDFAYKVMDFCAKAMVRYYTPYIEAGVDMVTTIDPPIISNDMLSREHAEKFLPIIQRFCHEIHQKGAKVLLHACGDNLGRFDLLLRTGADLYSFDKLGANVSHEGKLAEAREALLGKVCYMGNVDPRLLSISKADEVRAIAKRCIDGLWGGVGYVIMPGCDTPPETPLANLHAMFDTAREYRR